MNILSRLGMKRRLNLLVPERAFERLCWLQRRTDAASHTEVIRNSLLAYQILVDRVVAGSSLMQVTANGDLLPLPVAIDVAQPRLVESELNRQASPNGTPKMAIKTRGNNSKQQRGLSRRHG
jgi:hypothetical protein